MVNLYNRMPQFSVILPAAGVSARFGVNKITADLLGVPVIVRTVNAFVERDDVAEVVLATRDRAALEAIFPTPHAKIRYADGGPTRAHTVRLAVEAAANEWVAIHDAARPLVNQALVDRVFAAALQSGAAAPAMPVALTIKEAAGPLPARVERTVPRDRLWAMQTPQAGRRDELLRAFAACPIPLDQVTDDVQLLELVGRPVMLVAGEESNLKITTPMDIRVAELWLNHS